MYIFDIIIFDIILRNIRYNIRYNSILYRIINILYRIEILQQADEVILLDRNIRYNITVVCLFFSLVDNLFIFCQNRYQFVLLLTQIAL